MRARLRFRHFRSQLLAVLLVGLGASLGLFMLVVRETSETHAMDEIRSDFDEAARILRRLVEDKAGPLSRSAQIFAHDYSFIQASMVLFSFYEDCFQLIVHMRLSLKEEVRRKIESCS